MKIKTSFLLLSALLVINLFNDSCKKVNDATYIAPLFTTGTWQLASVMVFHYVGSSQLATDTLQENCTQLFTFNSNHTCTYTNFGCNTQTSSGTWSLSNDGLFLYSNMVCDTLGGTVKITPFSYTKIQNVGQYSLVLQTGDVNTYYSATTVRRIVQYGFVHPINTVH